MRITLLLLSLFMLSGCAAYMFGDSSVAGHEVGRDERDPSVVASDTNITARIERRYAADDVLRNFDVRVDTYEGIVTLSGKVGSTEARRRAVSLAEATDGVKFIKNQIILEDWSK